MNATSGTNDVTKNGVLEIAEAYHQFPEKVVPKTHHWGSICIIWGYLFGGLGLGFVTVKVPLSQPCFDHFFWPCFRGHDEAGLLAFESLQGLPRPA